MKIILSIYLSLISLASWVSEANGQNNHSVEFGKVFNKDEIMTINRIIEFYDSIVLANTSDHSSIGNAYYQYLDSLKQSIPEFSNTKYAIPEKIRTRFFASLNQQHLNEFYEIRDSINYVWKGEHKTIHSTYILSLKYPGKYVDFLKILSNQNDFMKEYYENIVQNHDIGPSNFARAMELYRDLDLNNENFRFVEIINLLMVDGIVLK